MSDERERVLAEFRRRLKERGQNPGTSAGPILNLVPKQNEKNTPGNGVIPPSENLKLRSAVTGEDTPDTSIFRKINFPSPKASDDVPAGHFEDAPEKIFGEESGIDEQQINGAVEFHTEQHELDLENRKRVKQFNPFRDLTLKEKEKAIKTEKKLKKQAVSTAKKAEGVEVNDSTDLTSEEREFLAEAKKNRGKSIADDQKKRKEQQQELEKKEIAEMLENWRAKQRERGARKSVSNAISEGFHANDNRKINESKIKKEIFKNKLEKSYDNLWKFLQERKDLKGLFAWYSGSNDLENVLSQKEYEIKAYIKKFLSDEGVFNIKDTNETKLEMPLLLDGSLVSTVGEIKDKFFDLIKLKGLSSKFMQIRFLEVK